MEIIVINEEGYNEALMGLSLSFYDHKQDITAWWDEGKFRRAEHRAKSLAFKGGGHNKFLASIFVWVYVQAPRCWWSEYDTYKVATTANSSSTMHTLDKRETTIEDYAIGTSLQSIEAFNKCLIDYKNPESIYFKDITRLKVNLPEGWLQERQLCINYMTLQNIISQRNKHRLKFWDVFIKEILKQVHHPELLQQEKENGNP